MGGDVLGHDPLGVLQDTGYRVAWLDNFRGGVWVIEECKVILADSSLTRQCVADALWNECCEQLRA